MDNATGPAEWIAVAAAADLGTRPQAFMVEDVALVLLRLRSDGPAVAYADRCPHRLVPLSAGSVEGGALRCAYHGWEFAADGSCVTLPSFGDAGSIPPRARLEPALAVREADGVVWLKQSEVAALRFSHPADSLTNVDTRLLRGWHPVALSTEVGAAATMAQLIGRSWALRRSRKGAVVADPAPYGLCERWGLVWLAPEPPLVELFGEPDAEDERYVGAWLPPVRTPAPAGLVADNFLDVAHFPFVHAGTFGAGEEKVVPPYEVCREPDGCRSVQEQWFDNPADPGVAAGVRPARQRRRATYVYRAPFQLLLRLEELDAGAVKTILFFAQPETVTSTRIYTKMLLYGIGGAARPDADVVAREVAFEEAVLAEDLALQRSMTLTGLPLRMRDELHVRADRLGLALRRELRRFLDRAEHAA
jgi:phenylpropionate dioxygenase-like ring-hydroxylating dioxygenase large terminal subunit